MTAPAVQAQGFDRAEILKRLRTRLGEKASQEKVDRLADSVVARLRKRDLFVEPPTQEPLNIIEVAQASGLEQAAAQDATAVQEQRLKDAFGRFVLEARPRQDPSFIKEASPAFVAGLVEGASGTGRQRAKQRKEERLRRELATAETEEDVQTALEDGGRGIEDPRTIGGGLVRFLGGVAAETPSFVVGAGLSRVVAKAALAKLAPRTATALNALEESLTRFVPGRVVPSTLGRRTAARAARGAQIGPGGFAAAEAGRAAQEGEPIVAAAAKGAVIGLVGGPVLDVGLGTVFGEIARKIPRELAVAMGRAAQRLKARPTAEQVKAVAAEDAPELVASTARSTPTNGLQTGELQARSIDAAKLAETQRTAKAGKGEGDVWKAKAGKRQGVG